MRPIFAGQRERLAGLDALRGIAALGVVFFHFNWYYGHQIDTRFAPSFSFPLGSYGVDLFFVISGFVIWMTLERAATVRRFAVSRFARLYPAFWAALCVTVVATTLDGRLTMSPGELLANLTMIPSFFGAPFADGVYWTLFYEVIFYVFAGAFFAAGGRRPERACLGWLLASALVLGQARGLMYITVAPFSYLFVTGIMVYRVRQNPRDLSSWAVLLTAIFLACWIRFPAADHISGTANGAFTTALAATVWGGARLRLPGAFGIALLFLGEISYSLYLVHAELGYAVLHLGTAIGMPDDASVALALSVAIAIAAVINKCVERPAQRWINNLAGGFAGLGARHHAREIEHDAFGTAVVQVALREALRGQ
jgi:peptidoglycan/LPS O-acetylase OafA/YrhL